MQIESLRAPARARGPAPPPARGGGPTGNRRLTGSTGAVLLLLLAVEGVTILFLRPLLSVHVFVGMLLVPPVALKLASTGYRFARYYGGSLAYRLAGPPRPLLRLIGPVVVASTVALFSTGVALLAAGPHARLALGLHKASFAVWLVVMSVHVLGHLLSLPRLALSDWRRAEAIEGSRVRRTLLAAALVAGVTLAAATLPLAGPWLARAG